MTTTAAAAKIVFRDDRFWKFFSRQSTYQRGFSVGEQVTVGGDYPVRTGYVSTIYSDYTVLVVLDEPGRGLKERNVPLNNLMRDSEFNEELLTPCYKPRRRRR